MKKVEIYGDSILKCITYSGENGKYSICREGRPDTLSELGIEVNNRCRMGATIEDGFKKARLKADTWDEDTFILLEYGGNDCNHNWKEISEHPEREAYPNISAETFTETYRSFISLAREKGAFVALATLIPLDSDKFFNWISKGLSGENILKWLGDREMLYRWHEYYNDMIRSIASEFDCMLVDLRSRFLRLHNFKSLICADGIHPTKEGHMIIRDAITAEIAEVMA